MSASLVGSEMCIRDSPSSAVPLLLAAPCLGLGGGPVAAVATWLLKWFKRRRKIIHASEYSPE
eukprot:13955378-Alexandrium_andersonii.AAC.1